MNSFLNPLMNPNLGPYPTAELSMNPDEHYNDEGQTGEIWTRGDLIDSLNHLIHVCRDGQESYLQAAEHVQSAWLQALFQNFSAQREQFAVELTNLVVSLGAEPTTGTTVAGVLHRTWIDLRTAVTGDSGDDTLILDECEQAEDEARQAYEQELEKGFPEYIDRVVQSQYQDMLRTHSQVRESRDAFL